MLVPSKFAQDRHFLGNEKGLGNLPRDIPVGNGNLLINHDVHGHIRCIYYPYVGHENHALDHLSRFGVSVDDEFFWLDHSDVQIEARYVEDTLVAELTCRHARLGLTLILHDVVDQHDNVFVRKVTVQNLLDRARQVKLFFHLDMNLYGSQIANTIFYHPGLQSLVFYKGHRYVSVSCARVGTQGSSPDGFACGQKGIHGLEGTWRDAEDGRLEAHPIAQGPVDGVLELDLEVGEQGQAVGYFWDCFAKSMEELETLESSVRQISAQSLLDRTEMYWKRWLLRDKHDLIALPADLAQAYKRSLLIARSNMDNRGAIIAANDSSMLKGAQDTYSYMWPRDGALVAHALDRAGFHDMTRRFFDFCKRAVTSDGFLMHKYNPDGAVGASWLPWINEQGDPQLPIQEDETALVVYSLWNHHETAETLDSSLDDYEHFVIPAADFMVRFRDEQGLPLPSYDLWEERFGIFAFSVASVFAGLQAAAKFAAYHGEKERSLRYETAASEIQAAVLTHMYDEASGRFARALQPAAASHGSSYVKDMALDSSLYALFDFGLCEATDMRMVGTMRAIKESLWVRTDVGGLARYEGDAYFREVGDDPNVPGNPWFICTLWYAEWLIECASSLEDLEEAAQWMRWATSHALLSGVMAEQVHPYTGQPLSVSPLTWSHATFVKVTQEYLAAVLRLRSK